MRFIKSYPFFEYIADNKLLSLMRSIKISKYPINSTIYHKDDPVQYFYLIKSGEV